MKTKKLIPAVAAAILVTGCVSFIDVEKAQKDSKGVRYVLPKPFLKVTPRNDGGVDVAFVYLPDPNKEYAVSAKSLLGNYTIQIDKSEEGFLELVTFDADSTGVAKQLIDSGANLRAAEIDARAAKQLEEEKSAKAEREAADAVAEAAQKAVDDANLKLEIASSKLALLVDLKPSGDVPANIDDQIFAAKIAVDEARVRLDAALSSQETVEASLNAANAANTGNVLTAPEPVFFEVKMPTADSVQLVTAFGEQEDLETSRLPKDPKTPVKFDVEFAAGYTSVVRPDATTGALQFRVISTKRYESVVAGSIVNADSGATVDGLIVTPWPDGRTVAVDLPDDIPAGDYEVTLIYKEAATTPDDPRDFPISVRR
tara:strand:+ start:9284 stop:10396 length:1113 start_codon:yes stop_codon:yes gene_type:complete